MLYHAFSDNCKFEKITTAKGEEMYMFWGQQQVFKSDGHKIFDEMLVSVKSKDLDSYIGGTHLQTAFPYLSAKEREFLKTGLWFERGAEE